MFHLGVSSSELAELRRETYLQLESEAMFEFSDGAGTGCLIEFRRGKGSRFVYFREYKATESGDYTGLIEDTLEIAAARLAKDDWSPLWDEDWARSLRTTAFQLREIVERPRAGIDRWAGQSLSDSIDSSSQMA